jgi:MFS family permease
MVLAASVILPHTSATRRGIVGGVIFAGVGLGVAASGSLVPLLLQQGLQQSWYGLGVLLALLTLASWWSWPAESKADAATSHHAKHDHASPAVRALLVQYGLNAVALVPHMVFIVDFVARGHGQGIAAGSRYWVLYGLGAIVGPLVTGHLGDRSGFGPALRAAGAIRNTASRRRRSGRTARRRCRTHSSGKAATAASSLASASSRPSAARNRR